MPRHLGALLILIGCSHAPPSTTSGSAGGEISTASRVATPPHPDPPQNDAAGPAMGEPCAAGDRCGAGLTCIAYYGIAGTKGPRFTSCETKCETDRDCGGKQCTTISDGPGRVCR
jgi:hypothetical protein